MAGTTLTLKKTPDTLEIKDTPAILWEFYIAFVVAGIVALFVTFTSHVSTLSMIVASVISLGGIVGSVFALTQHKASIVLIDSAAHSVYITRWTLFGRTKRSFELGGLNTAVLEVGEHDEGGKVVRPIFTRSQGPAIPISNFWYKSDLAAQQVVDAVNALLAPETAAVSSDLWRQEHSIETSATPAQIWKYFTDVAGWKNWNAGVQNIEMHGPFAVGTTFKMQVPGDDVFTSKLVDVRENHGFSDETIINTTRVLVHHRLAPLPSGGTLITYQTEITGPDAEVIGPLVTGDFAEVLLALRQTAEQSR